MHRTKARKWLTQIDNQLRVSTLSGGLSFFQRRDADDGEGAWKDPFRWPHITLAMDLESSGNSAWHWLSYKQGVNTTQAGDGCHGAHRDFILTLRRMRLYDFWILLIVWCNIPWGPDADELRRNQVDACMARVFSEESPTTNVLFQHFAKDIHTSLRRQGVELPGESSWDVEVWDYLESQHAMWKMERKCNLSRWMSTVELPEKMMPHWPRLLWERTQLALDCDFMKGAKLHERLVVRERPTVEGVGPGSTSNIQIDDRTLKSCCQNAVAVGVAFASESDNERVASLVLGVSVPVKKWQGHCQKVCVSAKQNREWLADQCTGGFMAHVAEIMGSVDDLDLLVRSEFVIDERIPESEQMGVLVVENDFATLMGQTALTMSGLRVRRCLWLIYGWPCAWFSILGSDDKGRTDVMWRFLEDMSIFDEAQKLDGKGDNLKLIVRRHLGNLVAVQQFREILNATEETVSTAVVDFVSERATGIYHTPLIDEINGTQKNRRQVKGTPLYRRPQRSMA